MSLNSDQKQAAYNMSDEKSNYFTTEALQKMVEVQGKTIEAIVVFLWQNSIDEKSSVEIIDGLQLRFTDGKRITISCNEKSDGLEIIDYNFKEIKKQLEEEFKGKIKMHALDASSTKMWLDIKGKTLKAIRLTKEGDNYKNDSVMLDFTDEGRTVGMSPYDGIVIDYHEEV
jgi:hypothetical protein